MAVLSRAPVFAVAVVAFHAVMAASVETAVLVDDTEFVSVMHRKPRRVDGAVVRAELELARGFDDGGYPGNGRGVRDELAHEVSSVVGVGKVVPALTRRAEDEVVAAHPSRLQQMTTFA